MHSDLLNQDKQAQKRGQKGLQRSLKSLSTRGTKLQASGVLDFLPGPAILCGRVCATVTRNPESFGPFSGLFFSLTEFPEIQ